MRLTSQFLDVNVKGVFFGAQVAAERMIDNDGGSIITTSSMGAVRAMAPYASIPMERFGTPEAVADVALFLVSDQSAYVNGESILVDGGVTHTG